MTWMVNKIPDLEVESVPRIRRRTGTDEGYVMCPVCEGTKRVVLYGGKCWEKKMMCIACEETGQILYSEFSSKNDNVSETETNCSQPTNGSEEDEV